MARRGSGAPANPGRVAAATTLVGVEDGGFAEDLLGEAMPDGPDGRLAWHLTLGTLRHRAELDAALQERLKQPIDALDPAVRACLRIGSFEKLHGRAPDHAVVQQWVQAVRRLGMGRAHGLVNAVLRRVGPAAKLERWQRLNHPKWLVQRWVGRYGEAAAEQWCQDNQQVARTCVMARDEAALDALLTDPEPVEGVPGARWVSKLVGVEEGVSWVMDPAAAMVADRFAAEVGEGEVLDACASPGGKTARLWAHGLQVTAADQQHRLPRLRENLERLGAKVAVQPRSWGEQRPQKQYAGVLVDAPCSGLGTLGRHPEIRWRRTEADLKQAGRRQLELLLVLSEAVEAGGVLAYAVCSPEPEEGLQVIDNFLGQAKDFQLFDRWASAPPTGGIDGHQLFLLRRKP